MIKSSDYDTLCDLILMCDLMQNHEKYHAFWVKKWKETGRGINLIEMEIEFFRLLYEVEKNPIYVWQAYICWIDVDLNMPEWISSYIHKSAMNIVQSAKNYGGGEHEGDLVKAAFGFESQGSSNNFGKYVDTLTHLKDLAGILREKLESDDKTSWAKLEDDFATMPRLKREANLSEEEQDAKQIEHDAYESKKARLIKSWREKWMKMPDRKIYREMWNGLSGPPRIAERPRPV